MHPRDPEKKDGASDGCEDENPSFVLNEAASGSKDKQSLAARRRGDEAKWQSRLALLKKYRAEHGHCRVPQRYEMDGVKLGYWLHKQRSEGNDFRKGKPSVGITQERMDQLDAVGMEWSVERAPAMQPHWQSKFELLRQFRERTGHCQVPLNHEVEGFKLGRWVDNQRVEYKKYREGKPSKITQERIVQLEAVGFDWNTLETNWQSKFELLRQFRQHHGHFRVPRDYEVDGVKLGIWLKDQKKGYNRFKQGKPAWITQERIDQLEAIGLDFNDKQHARTEKFDAQQQSRAEKFGATWQSKLELLRQYREQNGHCQVPYSYETSDGVKLGTWLANQRVAYKNHREGKPARSITQERIDQLEAIGMVWTAQKKAPSHSQWQSKFELLQQYKAVNGDCRVPQSYEINGVKLGRWLQEQRQKYKKHKSGKMANITQEQIDQLESIGVVWSAHEASWQSNLELLQQFRERTGHCQLPCKYEMDGIKLGRWAESQKHEYKKHSKGKPSKITQERINALNAIGFDWGPGKAEKLQEGKLASDTSSSTEATMPTTKTSGRKRSSSTDLHSSVISECPNASRQQASPQRKTQRLDDD